MAEILHHQVLGLVHQQLERDYEHKPEEREQEEKDLEIWAAMIFMLSSNGLQAKKKTIDKSEKNRVPTTKNS